MEDISIDRSEDQFTVFMSRLTPYTQYAYYLKTYTIASQLYGGQTPIQYLTTSPSKPDPVILMTAEPLSDSDIVSALRDLIDKLVG